MNKFILIVDDDLLLHRIVERMMGKMESFLTFIPCENGKVGLDKLRDHLKASSECIILLDLNMPVLDGWGFLDEMQSSQLSANQNLAVYILSSSTDKGDLERAKQYAMVRKFYHKPLNSSDIIEILNSN